MGTAGFTIEYTTLGASYTQGTSRGELQCFQGPATLVGDREVKNIIDYGERKVLGTFMMPYLSILSQGTLVA